MPRNRGKASSNFVPSTSERRGSSPRFSWLPPIAQLVERLLSMRKVMSSILIISTLKALARPRTKLCFVRVSLFTAAAGCLGGLVGHDVCFTRRRSRVRVSPRVFFLPIYETACPRYLVTIPRGPTGPRLLALREQPAPGILVHRGASTAYRGRGSPLRSDRVVRGSLVVGAASARAAAWEMHGAVSVGVGSFSLPF